MGSGSIHWFGIDFGTTNSAAFSISGASDTEDIPYGDGAGLNRPFPSLVAINNETGEILTGGIVRDKRFELKSKNFEIIDNIKSKIDSNCSYDIAGKKWTPIDIATEIFKGVNETIKNKGNINCKSAIVAVPVDFSPSKKASVRKAAKKAGIDIKMFISEPTAAFCSNYPDLKMCTNVAVFDWGGGTLDIAVLHVENGRVYEIEKDGRDIAGNHIDKLIAEKIHANFCKKKKISVSLSEMDPVSLDRLFVSCEKAKIALSNDDIDVTNVSVLKYGEYGTLREALDYDLFSDLIESEVDDAIRWLDHTIEKAHLNISNIDCILCVGGSSKLRPLKEKLINKYGEELIYYPDKVMWDIAKGAATVNNMGGQYGLNQDLGLIMSNGDFLPMIKKGQPLPCQEAKMFFATINDEKVAKFIVSDSANQEECSFQKYITIEMDHSSFLKEYYEVSCFIDPDMLFRFRIRSNNFQHRYLSLWTYDKVKVFYRLEGGLNG